jgi:hypothetical protein
MMASEGVLATLRAGWNSMQTFAAPKALIGGLALSVWNHARYTRDADVLVAIPPEQIDGLIAELVRAGFQPRHEPPLQIIDGQGIVQFTFQPADALMPFQFDVLLATTPFQRESLSRAVTRRLPGDDVEVAVVRPDDLIVIKLLGGRIIDRADAAMLLRENRSHIDFDHLHQAIVTAGLVDDYRSIWSDAFPGEPAPDRPLP